MPSPFAFLGPLWLLLVSWPIAAVLVARRLYGWKGSPDPILRWMRDQRLPLMLFGLAWATACIVLHPFVGAVVPVLGAIAGLAITFVTLMPDPSRRGLGNVTEIDIAASKSAVRSLVLPGLSWLVVAVPFATAWWLMTGDNGQTESRKAIVGHWTGPDGSQMEISDTEITMSSKEGEVRQSYETFNERNNDLLGGRIEIRMADGQSMAAFVTRSGLVLSTQDGAKIRYRRSRD